MAGLLPGDPSQLGITESGTYNLAHAKLEEPDHSSSNWYFGRKEIEENSPSRNDGIDLKKETYFRKSYCTFLQDLGMRLKVPQVTIATAIIFCHRFFLRQSHAKNDRRTIATVCMFLAGKVEETPRPLKDVILVSYEICNKKDPAAIQRIKQKDVYEQQKELILLGERVVLATLGFDLNVHHPYKPLVAAIKKFKVAQNALAQVAWNFVNDGLRTSLCLQYKPHHIAAGAIFLAAKFLKVKLPNDGEVVWWQAFEVTPAQLEDISNQMLELYEQNGPSPGLRGNEPGGRSGVINQNLGISQAYAGAAPISGCSQVTERSLPGGADISEDSQQFLNPVSNSRGREKFDGGANLQKLSKIKHSDVNVLGTSQGYERNEQTGSRRAVESKEYSDNSGDETRVKFGCPDIEGKQSWASLDDVNKDKVKAALEKRRRSRGEGMDPRPTKPKVDLIDEDDLIRELESGVEAAAQAEKAKQERKENWARSLYRVEQEGVELRKEHRDEGENRGKRKKSNLESFPEKKRSRSSDFVPMQGEQERSLAKISYDHAEEGKLPFSNPHEQVSRLNDKWSGSPMLNQIEKGGSPAKWRDYGGRD